MVDAKREEEVPAQGKGGLPEPTLLRYSRRDKGKEVSFLPGKAITSKGFQWTMRP